MERNAFLNATPRANIVNQFAADAKKNYCCQKQILFNFMGDPYCKANDKFGITRQCLEYALENKLPIAILTKGGTRCLQDIALFQKFGAHIMVGATLTFYDTKKSTQWEPGAANPAERLQTLKTLHDSGIRTFASFEPVIEPEESLTLMKAGINFIDDYKVGKLNNFQGLDKKINWTDFLQKTITLLRSHNKSFYIKDDLAANAPSIKLFGNERIADAHTITPWEKEESSHNTSFQLDL
jgi:hypothetical protein